MNVKKIRTHSGKDLDATTPPDSREQQTVTVTVSANSKLEINKPRTIINPSQLLRAQFSNATQDKTLPVSQFQ